MEIQLGHFVKRMNSEITFLKNGSLGDLQSWKTLNLWDIYLLNIMVTERQWETHEFWQ